MQALVRKGAQSILRKIFGVPFYSSPVTRFRMDPLDDLSGFSLVGTEDVTYKDASCSDCAAMIPQLANRQSRQKGLPRGNKLTKQ